MYRKLKNIVELKKRIQKVISNQVNFKNRESFLDLLDKYEDLLVKRMNEFKSEYWNTKEQRKRNRPSFKLACKYLNVDCYTVLW